MAAKNRSNTRRTIANVDLGPYKTRGMAFAKARGTNLTELLKELLEARIANTLKNPKSNADFIGRYEAELAKLEG